MEGKVNYWNFKLCGVFAGCQSFTNDAGDPVYMFALDYYGGRQNVFVEKDIYDSLLAVPDGKLGRVYGRIQHRLDGCRLKVERFEFEDFTADFKPLTDLEFTEGSAFAGPGLITMVREKRTEKGYYNFIQVRLLGGTIEIQQLEKSVFAKCQENTDYVFRGRVENVLENNWDDKKRTLQQRLKIVVLDIQPTSDDGERKPRRAA